MIRRHPDSMASDDARDFARQMEERYPYPDWSVTFDVDEAEDEESGESGVRELLVLAKRTGGVLEQILWVEVDEIFDILEMGGDWLEEVDIILNASEDELEEEGDGEF